MNITKLLRNALLACAALLTTTFATNTLAQEAPATTAIKTVLLVHGAWADGSSWSKVIPLLEARGLHVVAVQIPLTSFADDVAATRRALAFENGPVLLVGHSYAGAVITQAGNDPKVAGLVYVAAVAPDKGESAFDLIASVPTPIESELRPDASGFLKLTSTGIDEDFAQDLSREEKAIVDATQIPISIGAMKAAVTSPAWKSKPSWYIVAEHDRAISPQLEAAQAQRIGAITTRVDSCHVVMLSKPSKVADVIFDAASKPAAK